MDRQPRAVGGVHLHPRARGIPRHLHTRAGGIRHPHASRARRRPRESPCRRGRSRRRRSAGPRGSRSAAGRRRRPRRSSVGISRSAVTASTCAAGSSSVQSSTCPSPATRYGCGPVPHGAGSADSLRAVTVCVSPSRPSANVVFTTIRHGYAVCGSIRVRERHVVGTLVDRLEVEPRDESVQGVPARGLGQRELALDSAERVLAVDDAVRPRRERRAAVRRTHLVGVERHDEVAAVVGERAQRRADARDDGFVVPGAQCVLDAGRRNSCHVQIPCASR